MQFRRRKKSSLSIAAVGIAVIFIVVLLSTIIYALSFGALCQKTGKLALYRKEWQFPSEVFSSWREYRKGDRIDKERLADELGLREYVISPNPLTSGEYSATTESIVVMTHPFDYPDGYRPPRRITIYLSKRGTILSIIGDDSEMPDFRIEPISLGFLYDENLICRYYTRLDEMGEFLPEAVVAAEDGSFYKHFGLNINGIVRATKENIESGEIRQGGSTITQQLVKNLYFSPERTIKRKLKEIVGALAIEHYTKKDTILEWYLNQVYLGYDFPYSIAGVRAGAIYYFDREPSELSLARSALLAAIIPAPRRYNPFRNPEESKGRRDAVLEFMRLRGDISDEECEAAMAEPLGLHRGKAMFPLRSPRFWDVVQRYLKGKVSDDMLHYSGLKVFTTLDPYLTMCAESAVENVLDSLDTVVGRKGTEGSLVCLDHSGKVVALVGSRGNDKFNRALYAHRQPGSAFKIFVYLAALDAPLSDDSIFITPSTILPDTPSTFIVGDSIWRPKNYAGEYMGNVTLRVALERSQNVATTYLTHSISPERVARYAKLCGVETPLNDSLLSLGLGASELTSFDMAVGANTIANYGLKRPPVSVLYVMTYRGDNILPQRSPPMQVVDSLTTFLLVHILEGVVEWGRSYAVRELGFTQPSAGKTGTSNDERDAWYVGFTPYLTTSVWVGFDLNARLGLTGSQAAIPIWAAFNKIAHKGLPYREFVVPRGLDSAWVCRESGLLASGRCPFQIKEYYLKGTKPRRVCSLAHSDSL